ncbi:MAG: hypothetical protein K0S74_949 [Chlamydiales bacterium]|nr:hypothetical protein [Chlamydiales bacterium]
MQQESIIIDEQVLRSIINYYAYEPGVRRLKDGLLTILRSFNLRHLMGENIGPFHRLTLDEAKTLLNQRIYSQQKTHEKPQVGLINGLSYNYEGCGSLFPIQISKRFSEKPLVITTTGNFGQSLQESFQVALTAAWNHLDLQNQTSVSKKCQGVHIHSLEYYIHKDGPSAGLAVALAFYSLFTDIPITNELAVTGEIDLYGNVLKVGGIYEKIQGAKLAGIKKVIIPSRNEADLQWIKENEPELLDKTIEVILVENYKEAIAYIFN